MVTVNGISSIVLKTVGLILLVAGVLKGYQLVTEPVANNSVWTYRPCLIVQVELELALGVWLLSSLLPKVAWLTALACFAFFSLVTLYKGLTGAESCGCFGSVHVNPWITLWVIDLPAVTGMVLFRPVCSFGCVLLSVRTQGFVRGLIAELLTPLPSSRRFGITAVLVAAVLGITTPILAFNEPAISTSTYEVLEPETWVGHRLAVLDQIDVAAKLEQGTWLLLFYHDDCPDCRRAIPEYEQMARDLAGNEDVLRVALVEVPPFGRPLIPPNSPCTVARLAETKEWFVATPAVVLLTDANVKAAWEQTAPDLETVVSEIAAKEQETAKSPDFRINI